MDLDKEKYFFPPLIYESIEKNESLFPKISSNKPGYKMAKFEKEYLISPICMEQANFCILFSPNKIVFSIQFEFR